MAVSEKIQLLGAGLYSNIPDELTLQDLPTASELEFVSSEDFEKTMLESILPQAVVEKVDFKQLLEIDFQWICRALRILNYGPYHTTNAIFCSDCGNVSYGEYTVNLETIECKPLPPNFVNDIVISKDEFVDFDGDVHIKLPTIQDMMNAEKDKAFKIGQDKTNSELARMCYMVKSIKHKDKLTPLEVKMFITQELSAADYAVLKYKIRELTDYGLRAGGTVKCPKCGGNGTFIAFVNDKFFRPTLGDIREWKHARSARADKDVQGDKTTAI